MSSSTSDDMAPFILVVLLGGAAVLIATVGAVGSNMAGFIGSTCPTGQLINGGGETIWGQGMVRAADGWLGFFQLLPITAVALAGATFAYRFWQRSRTTRGRTTFYFSTKVYGLSVIIFVVGLLAVGLFTQAGFAQPECVTGLGRYVPNVL